MITKKKKERITCQRMIILNYLRSVTTHPSVEEIYLDVKKKLPRVSLGTVYQNLKKLKEKGEIQEIPCEVSHYDGDISSHAHFICQKCNKIFDIFDVCKKCSILKRKKTKVGGIKSYQIHFYGICKNCKRK